MEKKNKIKGFFGRKNGENDTIKNVVIHNKCKEELESGFQLKRYTTNYNLGYGFNAASDRGDRTNQEDSVIILEHPKDNNIKLLAVADGMGGVDNGEYASSETLKKIAKAFDNMDDSYFNNPDAIINYFNYAIVNVNNNLINVEGGSTLSMAVVLNHETLIFNIGDSRIYTYTNNVLHQETKDDSYVQMLYDAGVIPAKDMMRFHEKSNIITNAIGTIDMHINVLSIPNNYDLIFAASDGVTDFLSEKEIANVIKKSSPDMVAVDLVRNAVNNIFKGYEFEDYKSENSSHDNATVASLKHKR